MKLRLTQRLVLFFIKWIDLLESWAIFSDDSPESKKEAQELHEEAVEVKRKILKDAGIVYPSRD